MLIAVVPLDFMNGLCKQWRNLLKQWVRLRELDRPASTSGPVLYVCVCIYIFVLCFIDYSLKRTAFLFITLSSQLASYRDREVSSSCWRSRRCRRYQRAVWGPFRFPTAAGPAAAADTPPAGRGSPAGCSSGWRTWF